MFDDTVIGAMKAHAEAAFPRESCGLVITGAEGTRYLRCENTAPDPGRAFRIDDHLVLAHLKAGRLAAVIHSHPEPFAAAPSRGDMQSQLDLDVPFGIVPITDGQAAEPFFWGDGAPIPDLIGRAYRHGVTDCYSVARDWFRLERGIVLPDYPRGWGWWERDGHPDFYMRHFEEMGFAEIDRAHARVGDGLLIAVRGVVCHAGVLVEPGIMLHHAAGDAPYDPTRLSKRDPAARWAAHIRHVVRYLERDGVQDGARA